MSRLKQIVYTSVARNQLTPDELASLLTVSRKNNAAWQITGLLLHRNGSFMQFLEGPDYYVDKLFNTIEQDPRHRQVTVLWQGDSDQRELPQWSMAFNGNERDELTGVSDFLHPVRSTDEQSLSEGAIKKLLKMFRGINKR